MSKNLKVFLVLIVALILLLVYVLLSSELVTVDGENSKKESKEAVTEVKNQINQVNETKIKENYENGARNALKNFDKIIEEIELVESEAAKEVNDTSDLNPEATSSEITEFDSGSDRLAEIKVGLMDLTVPEEYKKMHLEIIMSFTNIKEYLINGSEEDLYKGKKIIAEVKEKYSWLGV